MKTNGNDPSMPNIPEIQEYENLNKLVGCENIDNNRGLTKREAFAMAAMQGMYNNGVMKENGSIDRSPDGIALMAVLAADELIKALNEQQ